MHSALQCPPVRTSCMRGCHSARKTRSPLPRKRLQERFLTYSWEWIMRHALDAFHCICNERWTQRKTYSGQISLEFLWAGSRHRWLPTECGLLTFRRGDAIKMKTAKICCSWKYAQQICFWFHYFLMSPPCHYLWIFTAIMDIVPTLFPYFPPRETSENRWATAKSWVRWNMWCSGKNIRNQKQGKQFIFSQPTQNCSSGNFTNKSTNPFQWNSLFFPTNTKTQLVFS